jgi:hypothetical protein
MSPAVKTSSKTDQLLAKHRELIAQYHAATTSGVKAAKSRAIVEAELDLTLEGVEFEAFEKPTPYRQSWTMTEAELVEEIGKLRQLIARDGVSDVIKGAADKRLARFTEQAEKRGIKLDTPAES